MNTNFLAVDLGASSGRVLLGRWDGAAFVLEELHRFGNDPVSVAGRLHWNVLGLWTEVKAGIARYAARYDQPLAGIAVDTWGVDFALLDGAGRLLGNPYCYRDPRTSGMMEQVFAQVPRSEIFAQTGIQFMQINTLYQLFSMAQERDPQLGAAETLLFMPDLLHYWMTGRRAAEYTMATTSQLLLCRERSWAEGLLGQLGIPTALLPPVVQPGTRLGELRPELLDELGLRFPVAVITPGSHDTASAVAAVPGLDDRSAYISSGTWSLMGVELAEPVLDERALARNFTNEGGVAGTFRLLKNIAGLWLLQECRRQWRREGRSYSWEELEALAERASPFRSLIDPDASPLLVHGDMPGAIREACRRSGQPLPEDAGAIVRCCLESLALRYCAVLNDLEALVGHRLDVIRIVGGGGQNSLLCQLTADACERPVVVGPVEATALGNLLVQAIATGLLPDLAAGRRAVAASVQLQRYEPRPDPRWGEAMERFKGLIAAP